MTLREQMHERMAAIRDAASGGDGGTVGAVPSPATIRAVAGSHAFQAHASLARTSQEPAEGSEGT